MININLCVTDKSAAGFYHRNLHLDCWDSSSRL